MTGESVTDAVISSGELVIQNWIKVCEVKAVIVGSGMS